MHSTLRKKQHATETVARVLFATKQETTISYVFVKAMAILNDMTFGLYGQKFRIRLPTIIIIKMVSQVITCEVATILMNAVRNHTIVLIRDHTNF